MKEYILKKWKSIIRLKNSFCGFIKDVYLGFVLPLKIPRIYKVDFFIWLVFTIVVGQLGIIINYIIRKYSYNIGLANSIYIDSSTGSFYIFAIATVASMLGPLFINLIYYEKIRFKVIKILSIIFTIFFLVFSGIIYSITQSKNSISLDNLNLTVDWTQFIIYFLALFACAYIYSILKLDYHYEQFKQLDYTPYNEIDDNKVLEVTGDSKVINDDGKGNKL